MKSFRNIAITITLAAMLSACTQITVVTTGLNSVICAHAESIAARVRVIAIFLKIFMIRSLVL